MGRPVLAAVAEQQEQVESLRRTVAKQGLVIEYIARIAGISPQVAEIQRVADLENPAQPVDNPPEQPAVETTEQAATPEAYDSPLNPGLTPGSVQHLPADTTGTPMDPGTTLPTSPFNNLTEVTAPVQGTEAGEVPIPAVRTEVDVRVGDPMNMERAFPWQISQDAQGGSPESGEFAGGGKQAAASNRTLASLRLARLQIEAGVASGDDLAVSAAIASSQRTAAQIDDEIGTLTKVIRAKAQRTQRPAGVVPRAASTGRTAPSLVQQPGLAATAAAGATDLANCEDLYD